MFDAGVFEALKAASALATAGTQLGTGLAAGKAANDQARIAEVRARQAAEDERRKGRRLAGKQRAAFGKAGVEIDEGTPLDVLAMTAADAETNAIRAALAFEQQADSLRSAGKVARTQGILGAGATLLGSVETFRDVIAALQGSASSPGVQYGSVSAPSGSLAPARI
jgi:hypothetical protein